MGHFRHNDPKLVNFSLEPIFARATARNINQTTPLFLLQTKTARSNAGRSQ